MSRSKRSQINVNQYRCLIDGYNLMFESIATPDPKLGTAALRQARERLLEFLGSRLSEVDRKSTWIVFDSDQEVRRSDEMVHRGMRINFARSETSADEFLCNVIRSHSTPTLLTVVSSDHQIQRTAQSRGAKFYDSEQWVTSVLPERPLGESDTSAEADEKKPINEESKRHAKLPDVEKQEWLDAFGFGKGDTTR
jgi:hypothetical protein